MLLLVLAFLVSVFDVNMLTILKRVFHALFQFLFQRSHLQVKKYVFKENVKPLLGSTFTACRSIDGDGIF